MKRNTKTRKEGKKRKKNSIFRSEGRFLHSRRVNIVIGAAIHLNRLVVGVMTSLREMKQN
jgi:hypothetical protein